MPKNKVEFYIVKLILLQGKKRIDIKAKTMQ